MRVTVQNIRNVETLKWPSKSLDLNPIESTWDDLTGRVYGNERHFTSSMELKSTTKNEWH